jgi:hypothetical protein
MIQGCQPLGGPTPTALTEKGVTEDEGISGEGVVAHPARKTNRKASARIGAGS